MQRLFFTAGALFAGLAVALGAATGHDPSTLDEMARVWLEKAIRYQFLHGLALIMVAVGYGIWQRQRSLLTLAGCCFAAGIILFSGSLIWMAFTGISAGYLTPLGGFCFLAGWLTMVLAGLKLDPPRQH